ncbi:MAG: methyltransferase domain-containing protein, partial [Candidatus Binatia bacterium]
MQSVDFVPPFTSAQRAIGQEERAAMKDTVHGFRQVDQATDAQYYFQFLDELSMLQSVQECRRLMRDVLGVHPGHRLLDIGCGVGDEVRAMARLAADRGNAVGLDNSRVMIAEATRRSEGSGLPAQFLVGDAEHLEFASESFDGCRSERTFMYLDAGKALDEMIRVTKPGGSLVVFDLDHDGISIDSSRPALTRKLVQFLSDNHRNGIVGRHLMRLFKERGLTDLTFKPHSLICPFSFFSRLYSRMLIKAQQAGVITPTESTEWFSELVEADKRGVF